MGNELINEDLINMVICSLDTKTPFKKEMITYEIQDDFQCLLITIPIDNFSEAESKSTFKDAVIILNDMMPTRSNNYSWMIAFTKNGKVIDGHFGGNLASPYSGL